MRCLLVLACLLGLSRMLCVLGACSSLKKSVQFEGLVPKMISNSSSESNCYTLSRVPGSAELSEHKKKGEGVQHPSSFCFPSVLVAGFPKCATSFLFHALASHPLMIRTRRKELCLGGPLSETWPKMISFLPTVEESKGRTVMSGCLHLGANIRAINQLCVSSGKTKVIFLVRDVADMLWAAYNYWCNTATDGSGCYPGKHSEPGKDTRSPGLFHTRIERFQIMGGGHPMTVKGTCYKKDLLRAVRAFGRSNVLVLKSEDLMDSIEKTNVFERLLTFVGLKNEVAESEQWLRDQIHGNYVINSGSQSTSKGVSTKVSLRKNATDIVKGLYEASNYVPMLPETRTLIYERWRAECLFLKGKFGISYDACKERSR